MIVDAHAHIVRRVHGQTGSGSTVSLRYGKVRRGESEVIRLLPPLSEETTFPPEMLVEFMDWVGVDRAVLLQGPFYGEENDYVWQAASRWPDRFIGAGYLDPCAENGRETFGRIVEEYRFHIIKFEMTEDTGLTGLHPDLRLDGPSMAWIWEEAELRGLVVTLDLGSAGSRSYQTDALRAVLQRHPGLRVVIAHLAQPPIAVPDDHERDQLWREQISLAHDHNVWFDLAALVGYVRTEDYPYPSVGRYIQRAVEMIGAERLMWGTDVPGLLGHATYQQLLDLVARHCDFLSPGQLAQVLGDNALHVYWDEREDVV